MGHKSKYILIRKLLTKLHVHAYIDKVLTKVSKTLPLPLIAYDNIKLSLGFYTLVILEDIEHYHKFVKPRKGWTVVDAGAHVGVYTAECAKMVGDNGVVIAIEPDPDNFQMLRFHCVLNKLKNVVPLRVALGSRVGWTKLIRYRSPHNVILDVSSRINAMHKSIECPIFTIDKVAEIMNLKNIDLLKLDVEGAEVEVIKGMKNNLPSYIVGEWHGKSRLIKLRKICEEKGYEVIHELAHRKNIGVFYAKRVRQ